MDSAAGVQGSDQRAGPRKDAEKGNGVGPAVLTEKESNKGAKKSRDPKINIRNPSSNENKRIIINITIHYQ